MEFPQEIGELIADAEGEANTGDPIKSIALSLVAIAKKLDAGLFMDLKE